MDVILLEASFFGRNSAPGGVLAAVLLVASFKIRGLIVEVYIDLEGQISKFECSKLEISRFKC